MNVRPIESIPISEIRVVNPRARNKHTFDLIVANIGSVGLKKPITVCRRRPESDGTQFDLVCGQGRLESIMALGGTHIPAIVRDATLKERYLMSLVENIARKRPPHSALVREVRRLRDQGCKHAEIATKLGLGKTYIDGILRLLRSGEDRLVSQVVAGTVPLNVAITIATADTPEVQRALNDAYDKGDLRGKKLIAVQRLISQRSLKERTLSNVSVPAQPPVDLAKEYEIQTRRQRYLLKRAAIVEERLALVAMALKSLLADERLRRLLRTEGLDSMPEQLASRLA
jgi:ParB family chromosome partitioning protein